MWVPEMGGRSGPLYRAIADALAEDASKGRLPPGTRLPTHRDLADRLGVTVGTVSRAYAEAARRGLVSGEVGRGTFARGSTLELGPSPSPMPGGAAAAPFKDLRRPCPS
jgi:DNA-binding transcriptional MocR family regulator